MSTTITAESNKIALGYMLTQLMQECDVDDVTLYRETGIPASTISRLRLNPDANPTYHTLKPIAQFFGITVDQLMGTSTLPIDKLPRIHYPAGFTASRIPLLKWEWVIKWINGNTQSFKHQLQQWISTERIVGDRAFALEIYTDTFGLVLRKGSTIILDPDGMAANADLVLLNPPNKDDILIKQIIKEDDDIYMKSINPLLKGLKPLPSEYKILGTIVEMRYNLGCLNQQQLSNVLTAKTVNNNNFNEIPKTVLITT